MKTPPHASTAHLCRMLLLFAGWALAAISIPAADRDTVILPELQVQANRYSWKYIRTDNFELYTNLDEVNKAIPADLSACTCLRATHRQNAQAEAFAFIRVHSRLKHSVFLSILSIRSVAQPQPKVASKARKFQIPKSQIPNKSQNFK